MKTGKIAWVAILMLLFCRNAIEVFADEIHAQTESTYPESHAPM